MSKQAKTIGLCLIVKNEANNIRRCLLSVLPLIDYIMVVDTGSTDGTQQIVREFLTEHGIRGAVIDEPWRDFAYNRTFALSRLREVASVDYAMSVDADDTVVFNTGFNPHVFKVGMESDLYDVQVLHGSLMHHRPQICRNQMPFLYKGVVHEYLEVPPGALNRVTVNEFHIKVGGGGARSQNPKKFQDDAALLESALAIETDPFLLSRYTFYLAQSYRDCGEYDKALINYLKRAELGYWVEEIYVSLVEAGNMLVALDRPRVDVLAAYERAIRTVPSRAEAAHAASHYCRSKNSFAQGRAYARRGLGLPVPASGLFVQAWVYDYGVLDEFSVNAYWSGAYRESLAACLKILTSGKAPAGMLSRVAENARFAASKLPLDSYATP